MNNNNTSQNQPTREETAFAEPLLPVNPRPFIKNLTEMAGENCDITEHRRFKSMVYILAMMAFGQTFNSMDAFDES